MRHNVLVAVLVLSPVMVAAATSNAQTTQPALRAVKPMVPAPAANAARKIAAPAAELGNGTSVRTVGPVAISPAARSERQGKPNAINDQRRRLQATRAIALPASPGAAAIRDALPGVRKVNGKDTLNFEPGGRYLIEGNGFGERSGKVTLHPPGNARPIELKVITWAQGHVMVEVPADISGVPDHPKLELTVASPTGRPLVSNRFGFHAAREVVPLPSIPTAALRLDRTFFGEGEKVEYALGGAAGTFSVQRALVDPDRSGCYERPRDTYLNGEVKLAPGFDVSELVWTHDTLRNVETADTHQTGFHSYQIRWNDPNNATLLSGIQRVYAKKKINFASIYTWLFPMRLLYDAGPGQALCTSRYVVTVNAVGPRGVSPLRRGD